MIRGDLQRAIGAALRNARRSRRLTLRDVEASSHGSVSAAALGGWERAERSITVARFIELAHLYGFTPEQLLRDALERSRVHPPAKSIVIDLTRLGSLPEEESTTIGRFAQSIKAKRGDHVSNVLSLRAGDLEVWAAHMDTPPEVLIDHLYGVLADPSNDVGR